MNGPVLLDLRSIFGVQARITTPASATGRAYVEMECTANPGSGTMVHYHPEQDESFQVLEGRLEVLRGRKMDRSPGGRVAYGAEGRSPCVAERKAMCPHAS